MYAKNAADLRVEKDQLQDELDKLRKNPKTTTKPKKGGEAPSPKKMETKSPESFSPEPKQSLKGPSPDAELLEQLEELQANYDMVQQQMKQERDQARQMKTRLQETEQKIAAKEKDVLELKTRLKQSEAKVEEVVTKAKASQEEARKFAKDAQNKIAEANANASRPVETVTIDTYWTEGRSVVGWFRMFPQIWEGSFSAVSKPISATICSFRFFGFRALRLGWQRNGCRVKVAVAKDRAQT